MSAHKLELVWASCTQVDFDKALHENNLSELEALIPEEMDETPLLEYAVESIAAVRCAIKSLLFDDAQDATWAAQCVQDSIARFLKGTRTFKCKYGAQLVEELDTYELMRSECFRQERDVAELLKIEIPLKGATVAAFKSRAEQEPALPDLKPDFIPSAG